jgi:hypothetical protein
VAGFLAILAGTSLATVPQGRSGGRMKRVRAPRVSFLGFDRNVYPGDAALPALKKTFAFSGYWLSPPPGQTASTWEGKRRVLRAQGFGFLVLYRGRSYTELDVAADTSTLGDRDAKDAVRAAQRENFNRGTVIFLDFEEGGRLLPKQRAYLHAWIDRVNREKYQAGVYCSGIVVKDPSGQGVTTDADIAMHAGQRKIVYWIYNDACPPSPGCDFSIALREPRQSGSRFASVWQFAQSPRRAAFTKGCPANYHADGNCYAPGTAEAGPLFVDLNLADSPDPSHGRR